MRTDLLAGFENLEKENEEDRNARLAFAELLKERGNAFHERFLAKLKLGDLSASVIYCVSLLLLHAGAALIDQGWAGLNSIIEDDSFLLAITNGVGLYLVLQGGVKLKEFVLNLIRLSKNKSERISQKLSEIYKEGFVGPRLIWASLFFGALNLMIGLAFGMPYMENENYFLLGSMVIQLILIGMIGGISVGSLIVVISLIDAISVRDEIKLQYFYPDKCGGTLVIGNILFYLSLYFILVGIFIFIFVHRFPWTGLENFMVFVLYHFWKIFPFVLAGLIFFVPVLKLNRLLYEYKAQNQLNIRQRINFISQEIMKMKIEDRSMAKEELEFLMGQRENLRAIDVRIEEMNIWPYNFRYRAIFFSLFVPILTGIILDILNDILG